MNPHFQTLFRIIMTFMRTNVFVTLSLVLLFAPLMTSPVQAKPIYKEVTTQVIDGPFPPDASDPNVYAKGVSHRTISLKDANLGEVVNGVIVSTMEVRLYELIEVDGGFQPGKLLFILKTMQIYEGTLIPGIPGGGMVDGKTVMDWVINPVGNIPFPTDMDLRGHWLTFYEDEVEVRNIGFGVFPLE